MSRPVGRRASLANGLGLGGAALGLGLVLPLVVLLLGGCGAGDRDMREPTAVQRAVTTTTQAPVSPSDAGRPIEIPMQVTSSGFGPGAPIPSLYTCDGGNVSPPVQWSNLPAGVMELALVVRDPSADGFVHWVITGLSPVSGGIAEGQVPEGAIQAQNQTGSVGWFGPCPPAGTGVHTYEFKLYAFSTPPGVTAGQAAQSAAQLVESRTPVAVAVVTATAESP